jgi:hypothetical protein
LPPAKARETAARVKTLAAAIIFLAFAVYDWESMGPCLLYLPPWWRKGDLRSSLLKVPNLEFD